MSPRPIRAHVLMDMAATMATRSSCSRAQVGALIARGGRILSSGYNGTAAGLPHCNHSCTCDHDWKEEIFEGDDTDPTNHMRGCSAVDPCLEAIHAEANAIVWAARYGVSTEGADIYTTCMPCLACAKLIISAGIRTVFYRDEYRSNEGLELLRQARIAVIKP